jgi:hypothetical protein
MDFHHHHKNGPPLQEKIGWRGALAFLAGLFFFGGLSFALFGDSKAGFVFGAAVPSVIWLGILYVLLDEDGDYGPPDSMGDLPSEAELDAMEATSDDSTTGEGADDDLPPVEDEVEW